MILQATHMVTFGCIVNPIQWNLSYYGHFGTRYFWPLLQYKGFPLSEIGDTYWDQNFCPYYGGFFY